jgi:hypothetical protein
MANYRVTWQIDIEADSIEEAARKAKQIQQDPVSTANVFEVSKRGEGVIEVDLDLIDYRLMKGGK